MSVVRGRAYCARVGNHWSGVVRTAREPGLLCCPLISRRLSVVASEALARAGSRGRQWSWRRGWVEGMGRDGVWVSMVLTSTLHRRCTSGRNRSIPTILAGCVDGGLVHVSAVDTEAVALIDSAGSRWPSQVPHPGACRALPAPAQGPEGRDSTPSSGPGPPPNPSRPTGTRVGLN